jgi:hypothetical protein
MRTAIVSDLHLGSTSGEDLLRDATIRGALLEEIAAADRILLLGDVVELRDLPLGEALSRARPFFEELGTALGDKEVLLVPGNHDHRFAEPLLDSLALGGESLRLEHRFAPSPGPTAELDGWLGKARLEIAYPGIWLRDDVYATHGHYMDCHLPVPRAECIAAVTVLRAAGGLPDPAGAEAYERILRPIYGLTFGLAQTRVPRLSRGAARPSEAAWKLIAGVSEGNRPGRRAAGSAIRASVPAAVWALNKALRANFDPDLSPGSISEAGVAAAAEMARRLHIEAEHVITGHTHRAGPGEGEKSWPIPGGGQLHNTGSWLFADAFHHPGRPPGPYWPGTVTWIESEGPPRRVRVLDEHPRDELSAAVRRSLSAVS